MELTEVEVETVVEAIVVEVEMVRVTVLGV